MTLREIFNRLRGPQTVCVQHVLRAVTAPITWTAKDAKTWNDFRTSETWKKLDAMSRDSMLQDLLPGVPVAKRDLAAVETYVMGRQIQMEYLARMAAVPPPPEPESIEETEMPDEDRDVPLGV